MRTQLHIGEIAQLLGITPKAIRHYQKVGLLAEPERTEAGYRLYGAQDLQRLQRIRRLQTLGLSLKRIKVVLGDPDHEHSLREVLQSLDEELSDQMQMLEERRKKIKKLLDENTREGLDQPLSDSPTFQFVQEHLAEYQSHINSTLWEQETQLYALLENFHWAGGQQEMMKDIAQHLIQHFTDHPEEYQALLALGERLASLASLPEDAPEVEQLVEDFEQYFEKYPFLSEVQKQAPHTGLESPFSDIFSELMTPIFSPGQWKVLKEIARRHSKEGNT